MRDFYPHEIFLRIAAAVQAAPGDLRRAMEGQAGVDFPAEEITALRDRPTYEDLERVDEAFLRLQSRCSGELRAIGRTHGLDIDAMMDRVARFRPFRATIMPEFLEAPGGGLVAIPHFAPDTGEARFGSLGQAAVSGAATVTVFSHVIKAEPVYPTWEALSAHLNGKPMPPPCGCQASYRVAIYDGEVLMPPRHPSDLAIPAEPDQNLDVTP